MPLLRSKIRPPALPATAIERPRLVDRILDGDWGLVLLRAPAGYGKSVLATQVREEEPERTAWLHLEIEDAEPRRFCRYLGGALATIAPALERTELLEPKPLGEFDAEEWMEDLLLFLQEFPRAGLRVVLDNYETVGDDETVTRLVERLVRHGSPPLQVVITSRVRPGFSVGKREAEGSALVLTERDLAFRLDEFREAARAQGRDLSERDVEALWSRSEGWCVYLGLSPGAVGAGADYLEEEILSRLPANLLAFLRVAGLLDVITPDAAAVLGFDGEEARRWIAELADHGVPHLILEPGEAVRLHPVVRERLVDEQRRRRKTGDEDPGIRLVESYRSRGRHEAAVRVLLELGEHERLLDLLVADWDELGAQDLHPRVDRWLRELPASLHRDRRFVTTRVNHLRFLGDNRQMVEYLDRVREEEGGEALTGEPRIWSAENWARAQIGRGEPYDTLAERWAAIEPAADASARDQAAYTLMISALYELRFAAGLTAVERVLEGKEGASLGNALNARGVLLNEMGRNAEALASFERGAALTRGTADSVCALNLVGKANCLKDVGSFHEALDAVEDSVAVSLRAGSIRLVLRPHLARIRGESLWHLGRRREAMEQLGDAFEAFGSNNEFERLATGVLIDHWSYVSGIPSALVTEADYTGALRGTEARVRFLLHRGRRLADQGEDEAARRALSRARELAAEMPSWRASTWFGEAWLEERRGRGKPRDEALARGLALLREIDRPIYPMADGALTGWIVARAVAGGIEPEQARRLVGGEAVVDLPSGFRRVLEGCAAREAEPLLAMATELRIRGLEEAFGGTSAPKERLTAYREGVEAAPLPGLRVRLFGDFEVIAGGREVTFTRKASRRVLEMLLLEYPAPVHEERLLDLLWPEADPEKAKRSLQTAVNELRRALDPHHRPRGRSYIGYANEHYSLELPAGSFVDLHEFRTGRKARGEDGSGADHLERVLALYAGELLPDERFAEFATEARERARASFLEGTAELAGLLRETDRGEAIAVLERGLDADPYWAEGVALLLDCLAREGRVLAAIRRFREYERRLDEDLGLEPDLPLRKRFAALVDGGAGRRVIGS